MESGQPLREYYNFPHSQHSHHHKNAAAGFVHIPYGQPQSSASVHTTSKNSGMGLHSSQFSSNVQKSSQFAGGPDFGLDSWIDKVNDLSKVITEVVNVTPEEMVALRDISIYNMQRETKTLKSLLTVKELENRIDVLLKKHFKEGAFMRTSHSSFKDAVLHRNDFKSILQNEVMIQRARQLAMLRHNAQFREFSNSDLAGSDSYLVLKEPPKLEDVYYQALLKLHCIQSGREAVELLTKSISVYNYFCHILSQKTMNMPKFPIYLRTWLPYIHHGWEFRIFVMNGKVTAISQFNSHNSHSGSMPTFIPELVKHKKLVEETLLRFLEISRIRERMTHNCSVDIAILPDTFDVLVTDVNPPAPHSHTVLFDYNKVNDRRILENGPLHFRVLEQPDVFESDLVPNFVKEFYSSIMKAT